LQQERCEVLSPENAVALHLCPEQVVELARPSVLGMANLDLQRIQRLIKLATQPEPIGSS